MFENASSNVVYLLPVHQIARPLGLPDAVSGQDQDLSDETIAVILFVQVL